ncbi:hypothetical protein KA005_64515 [bacterium]|nr:hypothetical protein [bacterium]
MSSKQKRLDRKKEVKTILKQIEKAPSDDIRELFRVSDISKDNFMYGIMEFHDDEQQYLIDMMLQDLILEFLLQNRLGNWKELSYELKLETLENIYDILDFETKADYQPELKVVKEKLEEKIEQHKKIKAERETAIVDALRELQKTIHDRLHSSLQQAELDAAGEAVNSTVQRCIEVNNILPLRV